MHCFHVRKDRKIMESEYLYTINVKVLIFHFPIFPPTVRD